MKRLALLAVLALLALAAPARANGDAFDVYLDGRPRPVGTLVICRGGGGSTTATLLRRDGSSVCELATVRRDETTGAFRFECRRFVFVFGCDRDGCRWRAHGRRGTLVPA